ncbi:hypothetical protein A33M_0822 [Rhodovulum sp. PH10]|nr:hypothetical protein A33M_0822 [Rhodovulum sp. PH10]
MHGPGGHCAGAPMVCANERRGTRPCEQVRGRVRGRSEDESPRASPRNESPRRVKKSVSS